MSPIVAFSFSTTLQASSAISHCVPPLRLVIAHSVPCNLMIDGLSFISWARRAIAASEIFVCGVLVFFFSSLIAVSSCSCVLLLLRLLLLQFQLFFFLLACLFKFLFNTSQLVGC